MQKTVSFALLGLFVTVSLSYGGLSAVAAQEVDEPQLCVGNYQSEKQGAEQLGRFAQTYSNRAEWEARAQGIREAILRGTELLPLPEKCPLKPIIQVLQGILQAHYLLGIFSGQGSCS